MKWITGITLNNYKAFKGQYNSIEIPINQHLLIYGENGSGKSSIYYAVKDFFNSSVDTSTPFKVNLFSALSGTDEGNIELKIAELDADKNKIGEDTYTFGKPDAKSNHRVPVIRLANKIKGFLDYKKMLRVHAFDVPDNKAPDIFDLIVKELLAEHTIPNPQGGVGTVDLLAEYNRLAEILTRTKSKFEGKGKSELNERLQEIEVELQKLKEIPTELNVEILSIQHAIKIIDAKVQLGKLSDELKKLLTKVFTVANEFLKKYFKNKLSLDVKFSRLLYDSRSETLQERLPLEVRYAGQEVDFYQVFLNEARLSAIAICLYLASIKTYSLEVSDLRVLYLDDVFIGLDTTNRFPLLEIIKSEFTNEGFQVFMSTYDREWFELSRHWFQTKLSGKIKSLELFIEDDGNPNTPDYPVVMPHEGNLAKAKAYFKAKDYTAAGNYLRKECEAIIKDLLPETYKLDSTGHLINDLESLMQQIDKLYDDCNLPKPVELTDSIKIYRKALLNPSSHSDSKSPLFKKEILDAFDMVGKLQVVPKIARTQVLPKGAVCTYTNAANNYLVEVELAENVFKVVYGTSKAVSKHKFRIKKWSWNGTDYATNNAGTVMDLQQQIEFCEEKRSLEDIFKLIAHSIKIQTPADLNAEMRIGVSGTLHDLLK